MAYICGNCGTVHRQCSACGQYVGCDSPVSKITVPHRKMLQKVCERLRSCLDELAFWGHTDCSAYEKGKGVLADVEKELGD